jgi:hypothetical protein
MRFAILLLVAASCGGGSEGEDAAQCMNALDDDGDGLVDCDDPGCAGKGGCPDDGDTGQDGPVPSVFINEFMASNQTSVADTDESYPDWIELYNAGDGAVDLGGFTMTDDLAEKDKHVLAGDLSIAAGGYLLLWADRDVKQGSNHLSFGLARMGEEIGLFTAAGSAVDQVTYGEQTTDWSALRWPDGGEEWTFTADPTPGAANQAP